MWQVTGQPKAIGLLERGINKGRLSHAYLFAGPPHVGKLTLAVNLAQAVNCESADSPCQQCNSCRRIGDAKHADVQIIDVIFQERKGISIDQVREMQMASHLPPYEGKQKVFIFDKAEFLSHEAANCLLKTLEEPSPRVLIILLAARENKLLPTIISRCQRVELRPISAGLVRETLTQHYNVPHDRAELLARLSGGCLGWALLAIRDESLLEQRAQRVATFIDLSSAGMHKRFTYAAELATQFGRSRERVADVLSSWLQWWRDLLFIKGENSQSITNIDQQAVLLQQAQALSTKQIVDFIHHLQEVGEQLEQNANPRLALEVLMLRMP